MQPRIQLAFWALSVHCWVILSFLSTNIPKFFSSGLFSVHFSPSLYFCLWLPQPRHTGLALGLAGYHKVCTGPPLHTVKSLWMASFPSYMSTALLNLVLWKTLLKGQSIPLSTTPTKMLKRPGPNNDPCGASLITGLHLDLEPLSTILWVLPFRQFLIHQVFHPSNPFLSSLEARVSLGTGSGAWH